MVKFCTKCRKCYIIHYTVDKETSQQMLFKIDGWFDYCPDGEIGRHKRLKISRFKRRAGSIPAPGTKLKHIT